VDVEKAQIMDRINSDHASPFRAMIDFQIEGAPGFLQFPGMNTLVGQFQRIPQDYPVLLPGGVWSADEKKDWLRHFYAFWCGVRQYFVKQDPRLWERPSEDNPNNLLKIVTLQEIQRLMLENWADSRIFTFEMPESTREAVTKFWAEFPATFFSDEWKQKGLQTSVGRQILRNAMIETRRNIGRKNWGHRRLGLFRSDS
jgi:hypothetical protein